MPDRRPQFDPSYGTCGEVRRTRLENNAKVAGAFSLAIGCIAPSESARKLYLIDHSFLALLLVVALLHLAP